MKNKIGKRIECLAIFEQREDIDVKNFLIKLQEYGTVIYENMVDFKILEIERETFVQYRVVREGL